LESLIGIDTAPITGINVYRIANVATRNLVIDVALVMGLPTGTGYPADVVGSVVTDDID